MMHALFALLSLPQIVTANPAIPLSQQLLDVLPTTEEFSMEVSAIKQQINRTSRIIDFQEPLMAVATKSSLRAQAVCQVVQALLPKQVTVPNSADYRLEKDFNWSQTCWLPAACFIRPSNAVQVAITLKLVTVLGSRFAVRGGGHNPNAGFASVDGSGVLLDLRNLDTLSLGNDSIIQVGPGKTWEEIYAYGESKGVSVIGGRHGTVGVSGYLLGGGLAFFPGLYGIAVDSVQNFQIVTGDSKIINANSKENRDLFRALKGGGANFGIVTRFDIEVHPLIEAQYTINVYNASDYDGLLNATANLQNAMESDNKIGFFVNVNRNTMTVGLLYAEHTAQLPGVFDEFMSRDSLLVSFVPTTNGTVGDLVPELTTVGSTTLPASRALSAVSSKVDYGLYLDAQEKFMELAGDPSIAPTANLSYTIQAVPSWMVREGQARGGNSLGLQNVAQTWWACLIEWYDMSETSSAQQKVAALGQNIATLAETRGNFLPYQFMNDAGFGQKVLESYGEENMAALQSVAARYDPNLTFQRLQNGGFLLQ
ncbi:FAD-binding domain-containing protein [Xylaria cf. heliscus]|nr:FAD-binding domain-containing protein [Xylaria cf. heliscus]